MKAIFLRELHSYFISPAGYVCLAAFYVLSGYQYAVMLLGGKADMTSEFSFLYSVALLLIPVLTMRLISGERRQKTEQILLSAPVTPGGIVAGKYLAALTVYGAGTAITLLHAAVLAPYTRMNWILVWGNILGLFLTGMAAAAIGIFISAHTESQATAALGSFAVMILILSLNSLAGMISFEPLREILYGISFYSRYYNMTMGILKISDILFFLSFAAVFLFLTLQALKRNRYATLSAAVTVLGAVLIIVGNVALEKLTDRFGWNVDLTADKRYAISEASAKYVKGLEKKVKITVLADEASMVSGSDYLVQVYQTLQDYRRNSGQIELVFTDLVENPAFASQYEDLELNAYDMIIECGENREVISFSSLYGYDSTGTEIVSSKAEQTVTNAIASVVSDEKTVITILTGYGEVLPEDLMELLSANRYEVRQQSLLTGEIDPEAETAVLYAPQSDLEEESLEKLEKWLDNGGEQGKNFFVFLDPNITELPNTEAFLAEWGITLGEGYVFESDQNRYYDKFYYPVAQYADADYAGNLGNEDLTIMALCRPADVLFEEKDNYKTRVLLDFSELSGSVKSGQTKISKEDITGEMKGMVLSSHSWYGEKVTTSNVAVSGSSLAFSGSLASGSTFANAKYILGVFQKLSGGADSIQIVPKDLSVPVHTMTGARASACIWIFLVILPAAVLAASVGVFIYRRHR